MIGIWIISGRQPNFGYVEVTYQNVAPEVAELRKKYRKDPQRLNIGRRTRLGGLLSDYVARYQQPHDVIYEPHTTR